MTYEEFVASKRRTVPERGIKVESLNYPMFDFQKAVSSWALAKGRACIFAGTGLGKTRMQLAWASEIAKRGGRVLALCPLAVAGQTIEEGETIGVSCSRNNGSIRVANYDQLHNIEGDFDAVILDESSILKSHDGAYRQELTRRFAKTPYKLCLSATPAPNDYMELGTHAEFMGICSRSEMLAEYFTHDGGDTSKWRLKKHGRRDFWEWVSSWAVCFQTPYDIGFDGSAYVLPELVLHDHVVGESSSWGGLFGGVDGVSAVNIRSVQRDSQQDRIQRAMKIESESDDPIVLWCSTNSEHDALLKAIPGAVGVQGSDSAEYKERMLLGFSHGEFKTLVTKASIAGFGMNWQHCFRMVFVSIGYSYELMYQAIRRCYRFGQKNPVHAHLIYSNSEDGVRSSLELKASAHGSMLDEMRRYVPIKVAS